MPNSADDRFSAMEDVRVSSFGLANFVVAHLLLIAVFAFWYFTKDSMTAAGLPVAVWVMIAALPVVWIQFWYFIRNSELRLEGDLDAERGGE